MVDKGRPKEYEYRIGPVSAIRPYGFTIEVEIAGKRSNALLDTGAAYSGIDIRMARELNLVEGRSRQVIGVTGGGGYPTFVAALVVPVLESPSPVHWSVFRSRTMGYRWMQSLEGMLFAVTSSQSTRKPGWFALPKYSDSCDVLRG